MRKYEALLLFSPELTSETLKDILDNLSKVVAKGSGVMLTVDDWGMRDLAYPVKKQMRGHYVRLEFASPGSVVAELERNIRITDGVFKFVTVNLGEHAATVEG